ncbi:390_t:CDS:2, partial [Acaulospora morrowiae]
GMNATAEQTVVGVRASGHLFQETFGQLVVSGRLGCVAEVVTEQTVVGVRISRHLFRETFGQLNKVPNDVSQWWIQWEIENFKEREKLIVTQDFLSQVEQTSARDEETRKRFWEVDALDKNYSKSLNDGYIIDQKNFLKVNNYRVNYDEKLSNSSPDNASIRISLFFQCRSKDLELGKTIMDSNFLNDIIDMTDASMKQCIQLRLNEVQRLWLNQLLEKQSWDQASEFKDFCSQFTEDGFDRIRILSFVRKSFVAGRFDSFLHEGHDVEQRIMTHLTHESKTTTPSGM